MSQNVSVYAFKSGASAGQIQMSGTDKYPNPFCDIASEYMPNDIYEMFNMAEYLWHTMPPFKEVGTKVVRYFLTDLEFDGGSDDERDQYSSFLADNLHVMRELGAVGDDFLTYGQSFISIYFPFDRYLMCPSCGTTYSIKAIPYKFKPSGNDGPYFECECPKCKEGWRKFERFDRRSPDKSRVKVIRWNPKHIQIASHPISGHNEYFLDLTRDGNFSEKIKSGNAFMLDETPWPVIKTCCAGSDRLFKFKDDSIYHMAAPTLAGMDFKGWSIPPLLTSFKLAYYVQLMRRFDEAMVLDFIVPFRVMYPDTSAAGGDMLSTFNMGSFVTRLQEMVARKRKNITDIQIAPFKIGYQLLGGEGKAMSPKDNIALAMDELLNNSGFPAELYKGTLNWQVMPVALRLFERRWGSLVDGFNDLLAWLVQNLSRHYMWSSDIKCRLRSVTLADDLERKAMALQAAAGGDLSKDSAYKNFGYKFEDEQKKVLEEQRMIAKLQQEAAEQDQIQQMTGSQPGAAAGGDPSQQAGYQPTMDDVRDQAKSLAQQLLFQVPESQRRGQLQKIKQTNPTLHALTLQAMNEMRRSLASQGQAALMQQGRQAAAAGQPPPVDMSKLASLQSLPSAIMTGILIQSQAEYSAKEMQKIAVDVGRGVPGAKSAFHFVYRMMMGDEGVL